MGEKWRSVSVLPEASGPGTPVRDKVGVTAEGAGCAHGPEEMASAWVETAAEMGQWQKGLLEDGWSISCMFVTEARRPVQRASETSTNDRCNSGWPWYLARCEGDAALLNLTIRFMETGTMSPWD
jgi:hypothetical protein